MDNGIFKVGTDVNACDCALGCTDTVREFSLEVDSGRKIPCRTGESNLRQRCCRSDALPTELHPHPGVISRGVKSGSDTQRERTVGENGA